MEPDKPCISISPTTQQEELPIKMQINLDSSQKSDFHFDGIFAPESSQEQVFSQVQMFLQSFLDGDNVCIFAYG